jgi:hypothetical protein
VDRCALRDRSAGDDLVAEPRDSVKELPAVGEAFDAITPLVEQLAGR